MNGAGAWAPAPFIYRRSRRALIDASPAVTVIVATYNRSAALQLALASLVAQDFRDFEAWVVGDACTDDSAQVVQALADSRLHWLNLKRNSGSQAVPNNEGLRRASGRYIAFLGHDDLWFPDHLTTLVRCIEESQADLVHALCAIIGPTGVAWAYGPPKAGRSYRNHFVPPSSWLHRRALVERCGYWRDPATLSLAVDADFLHRVVRDGGSLKFSPRLTVLKFTSILYPKAYANEGLPPQIAHWEAMQTDPVELNRAVLLDLAILLAVETRGGPLTLRQALRAVPRACFVIVYHRFGMEGGPLAPLFRRYTQRRRRRTRMLRGLPP